MVPYIKGEEEIFRVLNISKPFCAVTSVSDEKKGEKLKLLRVILLKVISLWRVKIDKIIVYSDEVNEGYE